MKFGGMTVSKAKRLTTLEGGNARLKKLLVEQMLDMAAMKEMPSKNGDTGREARRRGGRASEDPTRTVGTAGVRDCRSRPEGGALSVAGCPGYGAVGRLRDLTSERRRVGCRRLFVQPRREGELSWINRIYRLYHAEGLTVRKLKAIGM